MPRSPVRPTSRLCLPLAVALLAVACDAPTPEASRVATATANGAVSEPAAPAIRNVVLICIDTVRFDVFQALDRAAEEPFHSWSQRAVHFERTQSTSPWTVPSVASAFTGLHPDTHGAGRFPDEVADLNAVVPSALPESVGTLPVALARSKVATRAFVAHAWFRSKFGLARGFGLVDYEPDDNDVVRKVVAWLRGPEPEQLDHFLLYVHLMAPHRHFSWDGPERTRMASRLSDAQRSALLELDGTPACRLPESQSCHHFLAYAQAVEKSRRRVAAILRELETRRLLGETAVVLFSDHGEEFWDHAGEAAVAPETASKRRTGHGHSLHQDLLHVPLLVWHPGFAPSATSRPTSLVDIAPSIIGWLGLASALPGHAGRQLVPSSSDADRPLFSTGISFGPQQRSVVRGDMKRVHYEADDTRQTFDLARDPNERTPRAATDATRELDALLDQHDRTSRATPGIAPQLNEAQLRALQKLGYLEDATPNPTPPPGQ